jgi:rhodanese-related sulfurtransferase
MSRPRICRGRLFCSSLVGFRQDIRGDMSNLSPKAVQEKMESATICFVDVRSEDEFRSGHVPGAICLPLDKIESGQAIVPQDKLVVLSCQSGKRSARAREILKSRGYANLAEMEGGYSAWAGAGMPIHRLTKSIPVIRQVMIVAGSLVFLGATLGLTIHPRFFGIPLFVGAGLTFAGITGWCGMAYILELMPWNKIKS